MPCQQNSILGPDDERRRLGWGASLMLGVLVAMQGGCALPGVAERVARQRAVLLGEGLAVVVDACLYRQNPPFTSNVFLRRESIDAASAILATIGQRLQARNLRLRSGNVPYLCGGLANDPPSRPMISQQLGAPGVIAAEFPVLLARTPALMPDVLAAQTALMQLASEALREPRPGRSKRGLSDAQAQRLRAMTGSSMLLIVVARGASIANGLAATDVVMGLLLGGGGCRLGEDDCDYRSTTHEGARADALLIDLDHPQDPPRLARPVDIGERHGLRADLDPLKLAPYSETAWADALLGSLDLPDIAPKTAGTAR